MNAPGAANDNIKGRALEHKDTVQGDAHCSMMMKQFTQHLATLVAYLKLLIKGSQYGLPLSNLQLSHLLLNGRQLSSHCVVLLPCGIQSPGMLSHHLNTSKLHVILIKLVFYASNYSHYKVEWQKEVR